MANGRVHSFLRLAVLCALFLTLASAMTCPEGRYGLDCGMCSSDKACAAETKGNRCVPSMEYVPAMRSKTYECILSQTLQAVFTDGAMALTCHPSTNKTCTMAVFKNATGVDGQHAVDCTMSNCTFTGSSLACTDLVCVCTDLCSTFTKVLFETSLMHKPLKVTTTGSTITVSITGSPLPLSGTCSASSCETNAVYNEVMGGSSSGSGSGSAPPPPETFSTALVIAFTVVVGATVLIAIVACCFYSAHHVAVERAASLKGPPSPSALDDPLSTAPLRASATPPGCGEKLEFFDITCSTTPPSRFLRRRQGEPVGDSAAHTILHQVSGSIHRGQVLGLMGPSGSGKTTLLNALAGVANGTTTITGHMSLDGLPLPANYRRLAAYVHQDDTLLPTLTVRESMEYSAFLRLPSHMSVQAKQILVSKVLHELKLAHVAHSTIGSSTLRGISGGERRRLSIGMELVTSPSILFLDEPTSGLDSATANSLVSVLQALAKNGRMVVMSIHQPSAKSFFKLDKVLLLAKGKVMYNGPARVAAEYFGRHGLPCPEDETVADHLLAVVSEPEHIATLDAEWRAHHLTHDTSSSSFINTSFEMLQSTPDDDGGDAGAGTAGSDHATPLVELQVLFVRASRTLGRNKALFVFHVVLSLVLGLVAGAIFSGLQLNLAGFQNRTGAFYFVLTFFGFATLSSMDVFIQERTLFFKECGAQYYKPWSYFVSKTLLDLFSLRILPAVLFSCVFYYLMGLNAPVNRFLLFTCTLVLFNVAAGSLSLFISTVAKTVGIANLIATVVLLVMLLFGGFLLNVQTMPAAVAPLQWLSLFKYAFEVLMTNELSGLLLSFDAPGYPAVPIYGEVFLKTIGQDVGNQVLDVCCLVVFIVVLNVASYVALAAQVPKRSRLHVAAFGRSPIPVLTHHHLAAPHTKSPGSSTMSINVKAD
ncbi:ATP-binding Cassette (ABC) Superfamily [Achlya hypogyna]|uniref:ATP-binding Cassette (ABC) Superfamily n=1 Tax=Achlya hypogyna TaxID=1202772 RepID=A0A1V9YFN8_ACHHY|nr:ATP-binding Cassette (ABC) Superfamily [Achlya hypogyna]